MKLVAPISRRSALKAAIGGLSATAISLPAFAQSWVPERPVRLVVPFAAGGATDIAARILAEGIAEPLKQTMIVENRGGAAGNVGGQAVARADADGGTLLFGTVGLLTTNPFLYQNMGFNPIKDLKPISMVYTSDLVLVVHPKVPAKTAQEFVAYVKRRDGKMNYGSSGVGASTHTAMELFKLNAGIDITHVPYRGSGAAFSDLLGGTIEVMMVQVPTVASSIQSGQLRGLAVTGRARNTSLPDVPTMAEAGFPGAEAMAWGGLLAPAATPENIIRTLNAAVVATLSKPAIKDRINGTGLETISSTPEHMKDEIAKETKIWERVIKEAKITGQ